MTHAHLVEAQVREQAEAIAGKAVEQMLQMLPDDLRPRVEIALGQALDRRWREDLLTLAAGCEYPHLQVDHRLAVLPDADAWRHFTTTAPSDTLEMIEAQLEQLVVALAREAARRPIRSPRQRPGRRGRRRRTVADA